MADFSLRFGWRLFNGSCADLVTASHLSSRESGKLRDAMTLLFSELLRGYREYPSTYQQDRDRLSKFQACAIGRRNRAPASMLAEYGCEQLEVGGEWEGEVELVLEYRTSKKFLIYEALERLSSECFADGDNELTELLTSGVDMEEALRRVVGKQQGGGGAREEDEEEEEGGKGDGWGGSWSDHGDDNKRARDEL